MSTPVVSLTGGVDGSGGTVSPPRRLVGGTTSVEESATSCASVTTGRSEEGDGRESVDSSGVRVKKDRGRRNRRRNRSSSLGSDAGATGGAVAQCGAASAEGVASAAEHGSTVAAAAAAAALPARLSEERQRHATDLAHLLQLRSPQDALVQRNVMKSGPAPSILAAHQQLQRTVQRDHLARWVKTRVTVDDLVQRNILRSPDAPPPTDARGELGPRLARFLAARPTIHELVRAQLLKDVMMWSQVAAPDAQPPARNCHTMTLAPGGRLVVIGGYGRGGQVTCAPWVFDVDSMSWRQPSTTGPTPIDRYAHAAAAVGDALYIFGGYGGGRWMNDVAVLNTKTWTWTLAACGGSGRPAERAGHTATALGNRIILFGGNDGRHPFDDVWTFYTTTQMWQRTKTAGTPPPARSGHSAVMASELLYVFGGNAGWMHHTFNDVHVLDTTSATWYRPSYTGTPPTARTGHSASLVGRWMFVFGGAPGADAARYMHDLHVLDTATMAWSRPCDTGQVPVPRAGHAAEAVGGAIVVFGGSTAGEVHYDDVYMLDTTYSQVEAEGDGRVLGGGGGALLSAVAEAPSEDESDDATRARGGSGGSIGGNEGEGGAAARARPAAAGGGEGGGGGGGGGHRAWVPGEGRRRAESAAAAARAAAAAAPTTVAPAAGADSSATNRAAAGVEPPGSAAPCTSAAATAAGAGGGVLASALAAAASRDASAVPPRAAAAPARSSSSGGGDAAAAEAPRPTTTTLVDAVAELRGALMAQRDSWRLEWAALRGALEEAHRVQEAQFEAMATKLQALASAGGGGGGAV